MKNSNKTIIRELAKDFDEDFNSTIPITILKDKSIVYKDFLIKQNPYNNWDLHTTFNKSIVAEFFLKTCALLAAKEYDLRRFDNCHYIKHLDRRYQSHYSDVIVYRHNIKKVTDPDQYDIIYNKLEESQMKARQYQQQISRMFKRTFA